VFPGGVQGGPHNHQTAAIAVDALGAENVTGLLLPSKFSSDHSITDANDLATKLGIQAQTIAIEPLHLQFEDCLKSMFTDYYQNLTDENIQARIRGTLAMAFANNSNAILLSTGNKSEVAVGYCTLYGDMAGGFAIIKDLFKNKNPRLENAEVQIGVLDYNIASGKLKFNGQELDDPALHAIAIKCKEIYADKDS